MVIDKRFEISQTHVFSQKPNFCLGFIAKIIITQQKQLPFSV